jgi:hypothetical protein
MGQSMMLPVGLLPGGFELVPSDGPIVHRTFMAGVGPRAIVVGFPESVHVAFDANGVKLAKAWRGKFFDAGGMWNGRGGNWNGPLGTDVLDMPPGPAFAFLTDGNRSWPELEEGRKDEKYRNVGGHFKGYLLDKDERPTFRYVLGDVEIEEQPIPVLKTAKANLLRKFTLTAKSNVTDLWFEAVAGRVLEVSPNGGRDCTTNEGKLKVHLTGDCLGRPMVGPTKPFDGRDQLLFPIQFKDGKATFEEEISW